MLSGETMIVVEAALIFEAGAERMFEYLVVVDAPEEERIGRVMARDGSSRHDVLERIGAQMSVDEKIRRTDFTIKNSGSITLLERNSRFVYDILVRIAQTDRDDDPA